MWMRYTLLSIVVFAALVASCHRKDTHTHGVPQPYAMTPPPTTRGSNCTWTKDPTNGNVILGAGCTADDIFVNAAAGDFRLTINSPAFGNAVCDSTVTTDAAGNPRPMPNRPAGQGCDIGAYQYTGLTIQPDVAPPTVTSLVVIKP